jgi:hypothetical protein
MEWCHMAYDGASSGIMLMWDRRAITKLDVCLSSFVAACFECG